MVCFHILILSREGNEEIRRPTQIIRLSEKGCWVSADFPSCSFAMEWNLSLEDLKGRIAAFLEGSLKNTLLPIRSDVIVNKMRCIKIVVIACKIKLIIATEEMRRNDYLRLFMKFPPYGPGGWLDSGLLSQHKMVPKRNSTNSGGSGAVY